MHNTLCKIEKIINIILVASMTLFPKLITMTVKQLHTTYEKLMSIFYNENVKSISINDE